jgi:hypothetical protein
MESDELTIKIATWNFYLFNNVLFLKLLLSIFFSSYSFSYTFLVR